MPRCRITVLKTMVNQDLIDEYLSKGFKKIYKDKGFGPCDRFEVGQEFIVERPDVMPDNFCAWAWTDIHRDLLAVLYGANLPWIEEEARAIACCTDGLRPVVFRLERID